MATKTGSKRGNGEGSICEASDGRFIGKVWINGKRYSVSGHSRAEARAKLRQLQVAGAASGRETVGEFLDLWLRGLRDRGEVRYSTQKGYEMAVRSITPSIGHIPISKFDRRMGQMAFDDLAQRYSPNTIRTIHARIRRGFNYAVELTVISSNPLTGVRLPRPVRKQMRILSELEIERLLSVSEGTRWHALWVLLIATGIRLGEAQALTWASVGPSSISVTQSLTRARRGGTYVIGDTKTAASVRSVPLSNTAAAILAEHRKQQDELRLAHHMFWQDNDLVFTNEIGQPSDARYLLRVFKAHLAKAELAPATIHDLRHTFATIMFQEGVHPKHVQEWLGHGSIEMTLDTYSHIIPSMSTSAIAIMDKLIGVRNGVQ